MEKKLVAIHCITYNHEPYIRKALEGFVMQKTNFPFIAIVHDDASTDKTAEIVREYAEKYPDIIKPIYETENQYSKRDGSLGRIMNAAIEATGAKYIAYCEGDDYWTDPLKLQKQIDFLESHPDYSIVANNSAIKNETEHDFTSIELEEREYTIDEVLLKYRFYTASLVIRIDALKENVERTIYGDMWVVLCGFEHGKGFAFKDYMSVYRRNYGGVSVVARYNERLKYRKQYLVINDCIRRNFTKVSKKTYKKLQADVYWDIIFKKDESIGQRLTYAGKSFILSPAHFCGHFFEIFKHKINTIHMV